MDIKLFGITEGQLNSKLSNIFIGISLGNKYLTKKMAEEYVRFALSKTKEKVVVLIADDIDCVNWEVFRQFSKKEAKQKVADKANGLAEMFNNVARKNISEEGRILVIRWKDIQTESFLKAQHILEQEYNNNYEFKNRVLYFVEEYAKFRRKQVSDEEKDRLASYIIAELPTLLNGVEYQQDQYKIVLYPTYVSSGMSEFVLDIQNGKYPNLIEKLAIETPGMMIESYLKPF